MLRIKDAAGKCGKWSRKNKVLADEASQMKNNLKTNLGEAGVLKNQGELSGGEKLLVSHSFLPNQVVNIEHHLSFYPLGLGSVSTGK